MAGSFPEKSVWCSVEQICQEVRCKAHLAFVPNSDMYNSRIIILWKAYCIYLCRTVWEISEKYATFMKAVYLSVICQSHPTGDWHCSKSNWPSRSLKNVYDILYNF